MTKISTVIYKRDNLANITVLGHLCLGPLLNTLPGTKCTMMVLQSFCLILSAANSGSDTLSNPVGRLNTVPQMILFFCKIW